MTVGVSLFGVNQYAEQMKQINAEALLKAQNFRKVFNDNLTAQERAGEMAMQFFLQNSEVIDDFIRQDRQALAENLVDFYEKILKKKYGIDQLQFHLPPATSFFRAHKPESFGDDLSAFRKTVVAANAEKTQIIGLEVGRAGPGLRVIFPIFKGIDHVGSVEFGLDFAQSLEIAKETTNLDFAVAIKEKVFAEARRFADGRQDVLREENLYYTFSTELLRPVLQSQSWTVDKVEAGYFLELNKADYYLFAFPLFDYSRQEVGHVLTVTFLGNISTLTKQKIFIDNALLLFLLTILLIIAAWQYRRLRVCLEDMIKARNEEISSKNKKIAEYDQKFSDFALLRQTLIDRVIAIVKEPIASMLGHLQLSYKNLQNQQDSKELRRMYMIIQENRHLLRLIDEYHQLQTLAIKTRQLPRENVQLRPLLLPVWNELQALVRTRVDVALESADNWPNETIYVAPSSISLAINNLIRFLINKTEKGMITLRCDKRRDWVALRLLSTGLMLSDEEFVHILSVEEQWVARIIESDERTFLKGLFMGALTAAVIIQKNNGSIEAIQENDYKGFLIRLPLAEGL
jgi:hypothetical protein